MTELSIVIPARDAAATLGTQLEAIRRQDTDHTTEIIVVDDGSADATAALARSFETVRVVQTAGRGPSAARNAGAAATAARLLCFVDADDEVADGWLTAIRCALQEHPVVTGPLDLSRLNAPDVAQARDGTWTDRLDQFEGGFAYASSCNLALHHTSFDLVGGFDEGLRVGEDLDLCLRLSLAGLPIHHCREASVHYRLRAGMRASLSQAFTYGRAAALVASRARASGVPAFGRFGSWRRWAWLVRNLPMLRSAQGRTRWAWTCAQVAGRAVGGLRPNDDGRPAHRSSTRS